MSVEDPKFLKVSLDLDDFMFDTAGHLLPIYRKLHGASVQLANWNNMKGDPEPWAVDEFPVAVDRVNAIIGSDGFVENVPAMPGSDRLIEFLSRRALVYAGLTGRPEDIKAATLLLLERDHPGHFSEDNVHFTDFFGNSVRDKLVIAREQGFTHHGDDHPAHAILMAAGGIHAGLVGDNHWSRTLPEDLPPLLVRAGDLDGFTEYLSDEDRRLVNGDPYDPATARKNY
jgi:hypothetical protein